MKRMTVGKQRNSSVDLLYFFIKVAFMDLSGPFICIVNGKAALIWRFIHV